MNRIVDDLVKQAQDDAYVSQRINEMRERPDSIEVLSRKPIGGTIGLLRIYAGCGSLADLAQRSGLPEKYLAEVEAESEELDLESLQRIAAVFELQVAHLILVFELAEALSGRRESRLGAD